MFLAKKIACEFILIALLGSLNAANSEVTPTCPKLFNFLFENSAPNGKFFHFLGEKNLLISIAI